jgi:uncharacterized protein
VPIKISFEKSCTMRSSFLLLFCFIHTVIVGQDLFELIKHNNYKGVKAYSDAVNLRDSNQAPPLMWAVYTSDLKMVKLLVKKGADKNMKGWILFKDSLTKFDFIYGSCLVTAAGENKLNILKYFLRKQDIPIDDREIILTESKENGWTALQWAAVRGNNRIAKYLIRHGADINAISENDFNQTPLLFAINFKNIKTAKLLIRLGADVNQGDLFGVSPLTYALEIQSKELVKYLVQHGAILEPNSSRPLEEMLLELFGVKNIKDL